MSTIRSVILFRHSSTRHVNRGFTLVELMIATVVFSTMLLLVATALLKIGRTYYKGMTNARTQEATRSIIDEISQSLQFGGGAVVPSGITVAPVGGPDYSFCVGTKRFSFLLGRQLSDTPTGTQKKNILVTDSTPTPACVPLPLATTGVPAGTPPTLYKELLSPKMRLTILQISQTTATSNLFTIKVRVVYGDDDLLCSPSVPGDCTSSGMTPSFTAPDLRCKSSESGTQFCAVSELSTVVKKRVN